MHGKLTKRFRVLARYVLEEKKLSDFLLGLEKLLQTMMNDFMEKFKPSTSSSPTTVVTPINGTLLTGVEAKASDNLGDKGERADDGGGIV